MCYNNINHDNFFKFLRNILTPVITPGTSDVDNSSYPTDYKSNIDIDMHKPINSLDTDYRPNYDGKLIYCSFIIV